MAYQAVAATEEAGVAGLVKRLTKDLPFMVNPDFAFVPAMFGTLSESLWVEEDDGMHLAPMSELERDALAAAKEQEEQIRKVI